MPPHSPWLLRQLSPPDAPVFRELRLRAMQECPLAFSADHAENSLRPLEYFAQQLQADASRFVMGAFSEGAVLVGMIGFARCEGIKLCHKSNIWSLYVAPEARGQGLGQQLLDDVLLRAEQMDRLTQVHIAVTVGNAAARAFYLSNGFAPYGVEPCAMIVEGQACDIEHMMLRLHATSH